MGPGDVVVLHVQYVRTWSNDDEGRRNDKMDQERDTHCNLCLDPAVPSICVSANMHACDARSKIPPRSVSTCVHVAMSTHQNDQNMSLCSPEMPALALHHNIKRFVV